MALFGFVPLTPAAQKSSSPLIIRKRGMKSSCLRMHTQPCHLSCPAKPVCLWQFCIRHLFSRSQRPQQCFIFFSRCNAFKTAICGEFLICTWQYFLHIYAHTTKIKPCYLFVLKMKWQWIKITMYIVLVWAESYLLHHHHFRLLFLHWWRKC